MPELDILLALESVDLVRRHENGWRTTRRWQAALASASSRLQRDEDIRWQDARLPAAAALIELESQLSDSEIAEGVLALLEVEMAQLEEAAEQARRR